jgi:hypothetical protein
MDSPEIVFERDQLYEEVWTSPLTTLAKKYGLSDNGLRKICKAMSIPLPAQGHWTKIAAGHQVSRKPLPKEAARKTFTSRPAIQSAEHKSADDARFLDAQIAFEANDKNKIAVGEQARKWHAVLTPLRDSLRSEVSKIPKMQRDAERAERNPRIRQEPNFTGWQWKRFLDDGQLLAATGVVRVTQGTFERALTILNVMCHEGEKRGYSASTDEKGSRIVLAGHGGKVELRLSERLDERWEKRPAWNGKLENTKFHVPTGDLRLFIGESYHERQVADGSMKVEEQLNEAFVKVARHVVYQRQREREREVWHREWEAQQKQEEEASERRRELEARKAKLRADARAWNEARLIQQFLNAIESAGAFESGPEWMAWARSFADSIDPVKSPHAVAKSSEWQVSSDGPAFADDSRNVGQGSERCSSAPASEISGKQQDEICSDGETNKCADPAAARP